MRVYRRSYLVAIYAFFAGCVEAPDSNRAEEENPSTMIENITFSPNEASNPPPTSAQPRIEFEKTDLRLTVADSVKIPNSCHELRLEYVNYKQGMIDIKISSVDTSPSDLSCPSKIATRNYMLEMLLNQSSMSEMSQIRIKDPIGNTETYNITTSRV